MAKFIRFLGPDGPTYGRVEDDVVYTLSGDLFGWWEETGEGFLLDGLKLLPPCSAGGWLQLPGSRRGVPHPHSHRPKHLP